jgi:hypothetical protein
VSAHLFAGAAGRTQRTSRRIFVINRSVYTKFTRVFTS